MATRDPIALLMKEHEEALTKLHQLKKNAQDLRKKGYSEKTFKLLLNAVEYVDEEVRVHNRHEEIALPSVGASMAWDSREDRPRGSGLVSAIIPKGRVHCRRSSESLSRRIPIPSTRSVQSFSRTLPGAIRPGSSSVRQAVITITEPRGINIPHHFGWEQDLAANFYCRMPFTFHFRDCSRIFPMEQFCRFLN